MGMSYLSLRHDANTGIITTMTKSITMAQENNAGKHPGLREQYVAVMRRYADIFRELLSARDSSLDDDHDPDCEVIAFADYYFDGADVRWVADHLQGLLDGYGTREAVADAILRWYELNLDVLGVDGEPTSLRTWLLRQLEEKRKAADSARRDCYISALHRFYQAVTDEEEKTGKEGTA